MIPLLIMGGMAAASGILGGLSKSRQAKAEQMASEMQTRQQNFQNKWAQQNANQAALVQFQARLETNLRIQSAALKERALNEVGVQRVYQNSKSQVSKDSRVANEQFITTFSGAQKIASNSGTARAILRQNMHTIGQNLKALTLDRDNAMREIESVQQSRLAQRSFESPALATFIPAQNISVDSSKSALTSGIISGLLGAAGTIAGGWKSPAPIPDAPPAGTGWNDGPPSYLANR